MIDGSEKRESFFLKFEFQSSHVIKNRNNEIMGQDIALSVNC